MKEHTFYCGCAFAFFLPINIKWICFLSFLPSSILPFLLPISFFLPSLSRYDKLTLPATHTLLLLLLFSLSVVSESFVTPMDCNLPGSSVHGDSPGKNTGVGCHALLQGIFPTQGLNPGLPQCRWILYHLSHQEALYTYISIYTQIYIFMIPLLQSEWRPYPSLQKVSSYFFLTSPFHPSPLSPCIQAHPDLLSVTINSLHFLESYINEITQHVLFFCLASFTEVTYFEI